SVSCDNLHSPNQSIPSYKRPKPTSDNVVSRRRKSPASSVSVAPRSRDANDRVNRRWNPHGWVGPFVLSTLRFESILVHGRSFLTERCVSRSTLFKVDFPVGPGESHAV